MAKRLFWILFGFGAALRLASIWVAPLWYDENFTLLLSRLPFSNMILAAMGDVHPLLWYLIEWPIGQLGGPAWLIRLPSAAFGILSLYLFYELIKRLELPSVLQVSAFVLFCITPGLIYYSQEARMYSLLLCWVLLGVIAALDRRWWLLGLASIGMFYTQYYGLLYWPALVLVVLIRNRTDILKLFDTYITVVFICAPGAYVLMYQAMTTSNYWIMANTPGAALFAIYKLFWTVSITDYWELPAVVLLFAGLGLGLLTIWKDERKQAGIISILAFLPVLLALLVSATVKPIMLHRPLIGILPFVILLLVWPLKDISDKTDQRVLAFMFYLPILVIGIVGVYIQPAQAKNNYSPALAYIRERWQPGDVILHTGDGTWINWVPYSPELVHIRSKDCGSTLGELSQVTRSAFGMNSRDLTGYTRIWFVWGESPLTPYCDKAPGGDPVYIMENTEYIYSGVWLYDN